MVALKQCKQQWWKMAMPISLELPIGLLKPQSSYTNIKAISAPYHKYTFHIIL